MKMKKLVAGVLCLGLATFALTGCGGKDDTAADQNQDQQQQVEQQDQNTEAQNGADANADVDANAEVD